MQMRKRKGRVIPRLDSDSIVFSSHFGIGNTDSDSVRPENIGQKAAGLGKLPEAWTLPFFILPTIFQDALLAKRRETGTPDLQDVFSGIPTFRE